MFNPLLRMDRRQLAAKLYNDPSLAFSGDSKQIMKHRQKMHTAIARKGVEHCPTSPTNINREALYVLDNYPILRNRPKSTARFPLSADANYFAPSYLPKGFKIPQSPQTQPISPNSNRSHSAATCNSNALVDAADNRFVSWKRMSAKLRSSVQSTVMPRTTTSASTHDLQEAHSSTTAIAMGNISTVGSQGSHEIESYWQHNALQMEMQVAEGFTTLRNEITSYLKATECMCPRSTLEINALNELLADLEEKHQIYTTFIKSKHIDDPIILCQCLSSGIDSVTQDADLSAPSVRIVSGTGDLSMKQNVNLTHLNHTSTHSNPKSMLSFIVRAQKAIQAKLNAIKASHLQHSDTNINSQHDTISSLHAPLSVKPIHPWIRGHSSSRLSTSLHLGDGYTEESEIGIAPANTNRQISNSQIDDCVDSQLCPEFTLSTSTGIALRSSHTNEQISRESRDYDSPAVALVFVKEMENLSNEALHENQPTSISWIEKPINSHALASNPQPTAAQSTALQLDNQPHSASNLDENEDMFMNYYSQLDTFRRTGSPQATAVPTNSHMQQDTRGLSSPDVTRSQTSRSVQRMPVSNLKTPDHGWKPQLVKLESTVGYLERNKTDHKSAISVIRPRKFKEYCTVQDCTEKETDHPKELLRVPTSSPRRVTLELDLDTSDSPLKFGFFSTIKVKTAEATRRTSEAVANTIRYMNTGTREITELSTNEKYSDSRKSPSRLVQAPQNDSLTSSTNKVLLAEIQRYITDDISSMYTKFVGTLQEELAKKLVSIEKDLQGKVKTLVNQRKAEYENVRLNIAENKSEIMERISYLQESIKTILAAHKSGAKNVEKKVQLSLARAGIHERLPQISQTVIEKLKHFYCTLSRCLGNWVAMGYEQCTAITCQGVAGNGIRYILFPCGDSVCDRCQSANPSTCPICLRKYEFSVKADDSHCFNGPPSMLPTRVITNSCSRLRDLLLLIMELEDVEVLGYDDAEKKFAAKDSMASWQAYSRKLNIKGLNKNRA